MKHLGYLARPLLILDDGRIVIFEMVERLLQCYDPTTGNLADVLDIRVYLQKLKALGFTREAC
jgi:hypothetical protein